MADSSPGRLDEVDTLLRLSQSEAALLAAVAGETATLHNLYDREAIYAAIVETAGRIFQAGATLLLLPPGPDQPYQVVARSGPGEKKGTQERVGQLSELQLEQGFVQRLGEQG